MRRRAEQRGIPRLPLFFTLDQIAACLALSEDSLVKSYLWRDGHDSGAYHPRFLRAVNLRPGPSQQADWRVGEGEFLRWLGYHNLTLHAPEEVLHAAERERMRMGLARTQEAVVNSVAVFATEPAPPPDPNDEEPDADLLDL